MKRCLLSLAWLLQLPLRSDTPAAPAIKIPDFPLPKFATNEYGGVAEVGVTRLLRELQIGGVRVGDDFNAADSDYVLVSGESMGLLSAWLEAAVRSAGVQLPIARLRPYDGAVYANLLEVATSIAASRGQRSTLAIPVGVIICDRKKPWGDLPGDGQRDAYILVATERGFLVFDPPTRQVVMLADYPNHSSVVKVRI